jgi:hypothetical protein
MFFHAQTRRYSESRRMPHCIITAIIFAAINSDPRPVYLKFGGCPQQQGWLRVGLADLSIRIGYAVCKRIRYVAYKNEAAGQQAQWGPRPTMVFSVL